MKKFTPIAMRCSQKNFDSIKQSLINYGFKISAIGDFKTVCYLVNNFAGEQNEITNVLPSDSNNHCRKIHETFNAKIFLEACGIETDVYEITKETVLKYNMKDEFPGIFKKELEVGKWYFVKHNCLPNALIFLKEESIEKTYGFNHGEEWSEDYRNDSLHNKYIKDVIRKATTQEVESALICEAKKRYPINSKIVKIEKWFYGDYNELIVDCHKFNIDSTTGEFVLVHKNEYKSLLFKGGVWAAAIQPEKMTLEKIEKELGRKIQIV